MPQHPDIARIAEYLKGHFAHLVEWPEDRLHAWIEWYWRDARCGVATHDGLIIGVCLARCLREVDDAKSDYAHDERGAVVWVDAIAIDHPAVMGAMLKMCRKRFGQKGSIAGTLIRRKSRLFHIPIDKFAKHQS